MVNSLHGIDANRRPVHNVGKAKALWEETSKCTTRGAGVGDQARGERIAEVNVGKDPFSAGARSNLRGLSAEPRGRGGERIWVRQMSPYERRGSGNADLGGGKRHPRRGNAPKGQRGSRSVMAQGKTPCGICKARRTRSTEPRACCLVNSFRKGCM